MSLIYWLQQPTTGALRDITDKCRLYKFDFKENAEEGSVAINSLVIDDPDGDLEMYGHRILAIEETDAIDPLDRFVFVGFVGSVKTMRGPYRTGVSRQYVCDVADANTILSWSIMVGAGNVRPAETDIERIAWWLTTSEADPIVDDRYVLATDGIDMDANDYNTQGALAVIDDCAQQSGRNYWVTYFGDVGVTTDTPWGSFGMWYDAADSEAYPSGVRLTNILSDVNLTPGSGEDLTFYIGLTEETELTRDPMRVYSFIVVPFKSSYVSAYSTRTAEIFRRRMSVMPAINVTTKATATARAARYVSDLATPEDRATVKTTVPRSLVNTIRPGMLVSVKVTHWPGYADDYVLMRVLSRRVVEISEEEYAAFELTLELSRSVPGPPPEPVYGALLGSGGPHSGIVWFANPGDSPGPGWHLEPTTGLVTLLQSGTPPSGNRTWYGIQIDGTGTVDVNLRLTWVGVAVGDYVVTAAILLNGAPVAYEDQAVSGFLSFKAGSFAINITGLDVVPDDLIQAALSYTGPSFPFFRTPAGTGQQGESLKIVGGSLA